MYLREIYKNSKKKKEKKKREIYKTFPRKKQVIGIKKTMKTIIIYKLKCKNTFDNVENLQY